MSTVCCSHLHMHIYDAHYLPSSSADPPSTLAEQWLVPHENCLATGLFHHHSQWWTLQPSGCCHSCHVILHWFKFLHYLGIRLYAEYTVKLN